MGNASHVRRILIGSLALAVTAGGSTAAFAAKPTSSTKRDTAPPSVLIAQPTSGATVSGSVTVTGTASDNVALSSVQTSVDGGAWSTASGTSSWSSGIDTTRYADGAHTIYAKALDTSGNSTTASVSVTVHNATADTSAPSVAIAAPTAGSSVAGTVTVNGSASDNVALASVAVQVDGGPWQSASGTSSWSWAWNTSALVNGMHTVTARATDTAGNSKTTSESVTVSNSVADTTPPVVTISSPTSGSTVSGTVGVAGTSSDNSSVAHVDVQVDGGSWQSAGGTTSWTWSWNTAALTNGSHTLTARSTDSAGNTATTSSVVNVSNTATSAPNTQGSWVSPEGVTINVNTTGSWTISQIYSLLKANALDLNTVGPDLTINVQDTYGNQTQASAVLMGSSYSGYTATITLYGAGTALAQAADADMAHEYGHAWSLYYLYMAHNGDWSPYENVRWTTSDGSVTLATDSRTNCSYSWQVREIMADDYRMLLASNAALTEQPYHLNTSIPDPRNVPGLSTWLLNTWR